MDKDQQSSMTYLERIAGKGVLRCRHGTVWECEFTIIRLPNGRLRISVTPSESRRRQLNQCEPFSVEGVDEDDNEISATGIYFTRTILPEETLIGYVFTSIQVRHSQEEPITTTVECELTGLRCTSLETWPSTIQVEDFTIEIGRLSQKWQLDEHAIAYQYPRIGSYLRLEEVPLTEQHKAMECVQNVCQLLSVAQRQYVFPVAQHKRDPEGEWLESQYNEPAFSRRGWPRPLIPDDSLIEFVAAAYPNLTQKYQILELGNVIDHYLQALTLRSVWPSSLGVFTAMETLRAAFFRQSTDAGDEKSEYWVVPNDAFKAEAGLLDELIELLSDHFPRFASLSKSERQSFKAQLRNLNRRSYKTQLRRMLGQLGVEYKKRELQPFINIRNRIIHYGTPVPGDMPSADYSQETSKASEEINDATSLFERALLATLGYTGPRELFNAEEGRITDD